MALAVAAVPEIRTQISRSPWTDSPKGFDGLAYLLHRRHLVESRSSSTRPCVTGLNLGSGQREHARALRAREDGDVVKRREHR